VYTGDKHDLFAEAGFLLNDGPESAIKLDLCCCQRRVLAAEDVGHGFDQIAVDIVTRIDDGLGIAAEM
jgi:hypothetical protein